MITRCLTQLVACSVVAISVSASLCVADQQVPATFSGSTAAQGTTADVADNKTKYVPAQTTVAILPIVDTTGSKEKDADEEKLTAKTAITTQFTDHGFVIVDDAKVAKVINDMKIDLTDEEQQKRATCYQIGKAVGANLVILAIVTDRQQKDESHSGLWMSRVGFAKVKYWLLDDNKEQAIISAKVIEGRNQGRYYLEHSGSYLSLQAIGKATEIAFKDFLTPYPTVDKQLVK